MNKSLLLAVCALALMPQAFAEVYKHVDENGHVSYSSVPPSPGAKPVKNLPSVSTYGSPSQQPAAQPAQPAAPATAPAVSDAARQQLQQQLSSESKALADAQKALADGKNVRLGAERNYAKYQARIKGLEDAVKQHQNRVNELQQQMHQ